jgi:uncharacterized protein
MTMTAADPVLNLVEHNLHEVRVQGERLLFHVPTSSLFELDALAGATLDALRAGRCTAKTLARQLGGFFARAGTKEIEETLAELKALELVHAEDEKSGHGGRETAKPVIDEFPLSTLVLNISTGCNLACSYCYKSDLATPATAEKMRFETARAAIEMLLRTSPDEPLYHIVFFGGEPLTRKALIAQVVEWCEARFSTLGKRVEFTMTTNATLLDDETIAWLDAHAFGLSISIDGPAAIHDRNRRTIGGMGTYATVRKKTERLLARYRSRPVGARVTLTTGTIDVEGIWEHLRQEIGFAEVGFAPVTAGDLDAFDLSPAELREVFAAFHRLGERAVTAALAGENLGFSNLHQILTSLHEGHKKLLPCGAGLKMLAVDPQGALKLCHRFTGADAPAFGNVQRGIEQKKLAGFLTARLEREEPACATCRIRNLCAGGCYHESHVRYGDAAHPVFHYCEPMRAWVDFGISAYARILAGNPAFIDTHISTRRTHA